MFPARKKMPPYPPAIAVVKSQFSIVTVESLPAHTAPPSPALVHHSRGKIVLVCCVLTVGQG